MSDKYTLEEALKLLGVKLPPPPPPPPPPKTKAIPKTPAIEDFFWRINSFCGIKVTPALQLPPDGRAWAGNSKAEWAHAIQKDCVGWRPLMVGERYDCDRDQYWNPIAKTWKMGFKKFVITAKHIRPMRTTRPMPNS